MRDVIRHTFEKKYPHLVEPNIRTFDRGYNEVKFKTFEVPPGSRIAPFVRPEPVLVMKHNLLADLLSIPEIVFLKI